MQCIRSTTKMREHSTGQIPYDTNTRLGHQLSFCVQTSIVWELCKLTGVVYSINNTNARAFHRMRFSNVISHSIQCDITFKCDNHIWKIEMWLSHLNVVYKRYATGSRTGIQPSRRRLPATSPESPQDRFEGSTQYQWESSWLWVSNGMLGSALRSVFVMPISCLHHAAWSILAAWRRPKHIESIERGWACVSGRRRSVSRFL